MWQPLPGDSKGVALCPRAAAPGWEATTAMTGGALTPSPCSSRAVGASSAHQLLTLPLGLLMAQHLSQTISKTNIELHFWNGTHD